ncbi:relaxase/mobilization nuclease domain protein [Ruminococcus albus 8]|uniref:Relaxase/mobilization nuclease domain protein n=1 Tax=Ruminococcus albus 8 TaxID=246199 RepID=E9SCI1_RUMAL|nr:relaxase/mobilization nuclease domain protein [Ruminococcus albus 8]MCC3352336.1 relaxase/mobilization nuclease domain-containing protein [Ruminococcus albus 8]
MAYTSIHTIRATVSAAIAYITNGDKTVNGIYVNSYACRSDSAGASEDFRAVRGTGTGRTQILAYHMIQSFAPSEVTPEQAMQIGEELCDRYLKGDYQYVIAVHNDKDHLHCHIIFNNTNLYNGLSFTTEHNQGRKSERAWAELREISDEICKEHGLSLIDPKGKGVSYLELLKQEEGKSWKEKLHVRIAEVMLYSRDFADFLKNCTSAGIEYVYTPKNKYKLKFKLSGDGQQRFTRAETLGEGFTVESITEQIAEIQEKLLAANVTPDMLIEPPKPVVPKTEPKPTQAVTAPTTPKQSAEPENTTETSETAKRKAAAEQVEKFFAARRARRQAQLDMLNASASKPAEPKPEPSAPTPQPTPTESKAPEKKEDVWAEIRGMRDCDKMIADLEAGGITSLDDLKGFFWNFKHPDDHTDELAKLRAKIEPIDKLIAMMEQHSQNYDIYKEYQERSAFTQKSFRKKNAAAIDAFEEADKYIAEHIKPYYIKGKMPKQNDLQAKSTKLKEKYNALLPEHNAFVTKRDTAHKYTRQVRNYLQNKEQQERNRQYQERKRSQQKKKDTLE